MQLSKITLLLMVFLCSISFADNGLQKLPEDNGYNLATFDVREDEDMGREFMHELLETTKLCDDPMLNDYLTSLGNKLIRGSHISGKVFRFFIVDDPSINAFAGPGGYIGANAGLFLATQNESELAAVLAHEIGHVRQNHIKQTMDRAKKLNVSTLAVLLAAAVVGNKVSADVGAAASIATMNAATQNMLSFTRSNETDADHVGMEILVNAHFDPMAMPNFFARMQRIYLDYHQEIPPYLQTHPVTNDRIAAAEDRATQLPKVAISSMDEYLLMRARLKVLVMPQPYEAKEYFQQQLQLNDPTQKYANEYGYALALVASNEFAAADSMVTNLNKEYPQEVVYFLTLSDIKTHEHDYPAALSLLDAALHQHPTYLPLVLQYAQTLLATKQATEAWQFLLKMEPMYRDKPSFYILLATAAGVSGHLLEAYEARANAYEFYGNYPMALVQLRQALTVPDIDIRRKNTINREIQLLQQKIKSSTL